MVISTSGLISQVFYCKRTADTGTEMRHGGMEAGSQLDYLKRLKPMYDILIGSLILSTIHALIPNHWLPSLPLARQNWTRNQTLWQRPLPPCRIPLALLSLGLSSASLVISSLQICNNLRVDSAWHPGRTGGVLHSCNIFSLHYHDHDHDHGLKKI
jgi:hypothetical protein